MYIFKCIYHSGALVMTLGYDCKTCRCKLTSPAFSEFSRNFSLPYKSEDPGGRAAIATRAKPRLAIYSEEKNVEKMQFP